MRGVVARSALLRFVVLSAIQLVTIKMSAATCDALSIGTPGTKWGVTEIKRWRMTRVKQRSYYEDVVPKIEALRKKCENIFEVVQYGELPLIVDDDEDAATCEGKSPFPLFAIRSRNWSKDKPNVLITGGVHGYETSGVMGALLFAESGKAEYYSKYFNIFVAPCISPWGYERVQRWNANAVDPNRSFNPDGEIVEGRSFNPEAATGESTALIQFLKGDNMKQLMGDNSMDNWICHIDLHETTDTDETEFRPAKSARDGIVWTEESKGEIPDGFYLVQDTTSPKSGWFAAMIDSVKKVTHIAPADSEGKLIGEEISQEGVIGIPNNKHLGLCAGVTNAPYRATTEVYPDSPKATPEQCNEAQVACIVGGLDYIISEEKIIAATME
mmetsp:Transcript_16889/g.25105  ORF Transcript_16889/g.25105 Transcript_16889/m.25105 type:complete len:385 (-) Transcript_16889:146-1300(-)